MADKNAEVYYIFENDKLVSGGYYFDLDTSNGWRYISAYDEIKSMLLEVYGDPIVDKIHYVYGESLTDFMDDVLALEAGYTTYAAQWETNTTEILLGMYKANTKISQCPKQKKWATQNLLCCPNFMCCYAVMRQPLELLSTPLQSFQFGCRSMHLNRYEQI